MSLVEISNVVLVLSNPLRSGLGNGPSTVVKNITAVSNRLAYSSRFSQNLVTLASSYITTSQNIQGLLYIPDLAANDPCQQNVSALVPPTVTRRANLPPTSFNLVGIAPWISTGCTRSFLASARVDPIRAFIFYQPTNSTDAPPPADDDTWDLDENDYWKTENRFPVFAVPGAVGAEMMSQLSLYSGNITSVPNGPQISSLYDPSQQDYVRIWTQLNFSADNSLTSFWITIPIGISMLLAIIVVTTLSIHFIRRRRRSYLRRRVETGDVNLEALGIKRLTVPADHIQTFPLFTYTHHYDAPPPGSPTIGPTSSISISISPLEKSSGSLDHQPECHICLDAFEDRRTVIRELSCGHIFHPACVDEFLGSVSSLCPICKASMLPRGYSPPITNEMVRREIAIRKLRPRIDVDEGYNDSDSAGNRRRIHSWGSSVKRHVMHISGSMGDNTVKQQQQQTTQPVSEHTRQRMLQLAGPDLESGHEEDRKGRPRWKRAVLSMFR